jgi:hypothetical protein
MPLQPVTQRNLHDKHQVMIKFAAKAPISGLQRVAPTLLGSGAEKKQ